MTSAGGAAYIVWATSGYSNFLMGTLHVTTTPCYSTCYNKLHVTLTLAGLHPYATKPALGLAPRAPK